MRVNLSAARVGSLDVASIKAIPVSSAKTAGAAEAASRHTANAVAILRFTVF